MNELVEENQKHSSNGHNVDHEIKLFKNALEFSETKVRDCMTPRTEIKSVEMLGSSKEVNWYIELNDFSNQLGFLADHRGNFRELLVPVTALIVQDLLLLHGPGEDAE